MGRKASWIRCEFPVDAVVPVVYHRTVVVGVGSPTGQHLIKKGNRKLTTQNVSGADETMNKSELTEAIAEQADLTKADAGRALDAMINSISKTLKKGDTVSLIGFGTFSVKKRAARTGRNPATGETIKIKASKTPSFKAGKSLKDAVK